MPKDKLIKKAADMLLRGATLLGEPCPYCGGVRVLKQGDALCINCGAEPRKETNEKVTKSNTANGDFQNKDDMITVLEKKLNSLRLELEQETDHKKQQEIINLIKSLVETREKLNS